MPIVFQPETRLVNSLRIGSDGRRPLRAYFRVCMRTRSDLRTDDHLKCRIVGISANVELRGDLPGPPIGGKRDRNHVESVFRLGILGAEGWIVAPDFRD